MVSQWVENISIHAPPRGATRRTRFWQLARYFNSRPSARGDTIGKVIEQPGSLFQFTPLREGRPAAGVVGAGAWYFNSRPSARGDQAREDNQENQQRFQFTPLREGRPGHRDGDNPLQAFQFTPLREGRRAGQCRVLLPDSHFNSRPSARGDGYACYSFQLRYISIHAPPRGATLRTGHLVTPLNISIHAPPRGATTPKKVVS